MKKLISVVVAIVAGLVVLQPVSANAESYVRRDAAKDVIHLDEDGNMVSDPERADGDIVTSGVSYAGKRVWLAMSFSDLGHDSEFSGYLFAIRTNERKKRVLAIFATPGEGWQATLSGPRGRVRCRGMATRVEYVNRRVRAVIPKRCLSSPRWVQLSMGTLTFKGFEEDADEINIYADDALLNGGLEGASWGPRVRRG